MSRYIDADQLIYSYVPIAPVLKGGSIKYEWVAYKAEIDAMPAADVRENVKGEWLQDKHDEAGYGYFDCSVCGADFYDVYDFCPNCGADMREDMRGEV